MLIIQWKYKSKRERGRFFYRKTWKYITQCVIFLMTNAHCFFCLLLLLQIIKLLRERPDIYIGGVATRRQNVMHRHTNAHTCMAIYCVIKLNYKKV